MQVTVQKSDNGTHYIRVEEQIADAFHEKKVRRVLCRINGHPPLHSALIRRKPGETYIFLGKKHLRNLQIQAQDRVTAELEEDTSPYQFDMPEEFEEVLASDEEAQRIFESLTPGNQRSLIYLVSAVKSSNKKIDRALKIAESLKNGIHSPREVLK